MSKSILAATAAAALALALVSAAPAVAQLPPGVFAGEHDYKAAPAGTYTVDPAHTAVISKVSHIGYSMSVFRFDKVDGTLTWDPAQPAKSALNVSAETASISTPVPGFAAELSGDKYLNSAAFPKATFVSTAFHQIDASHGKVDGQFTLMGKTAPMTLNVTLVGAGKGFFNHARIGAHAEGELQTADFGLPALLGSTIQIVMDTEFERQG